MTNQHQKQVVWDEYTAETIRGVNQLQVNVQENDPRATRFHLCKEWSRQGLND